MQDCHHSMMRILCENRKYKINAIPARDIVCVRNFDGICVTFKEETTKLRTH